MRRPAYATGFSLATSLVPALVLGPTIALALALSVAACDAAGPAATTAPRANLGSGTMRTPLNPRLVARGKQIFRYDDFGDSDFWTDTLHLNDVVETLTPLDALSLGLKVDVDAIPPEVLQAVLASPALLSDAATTRALLSLDAVVGVKAKVEGDQIASIGITCALCHSSVDDAVTAGIGHRLDGWPNHDLRVGTIVGASPAIPPSSPFGLYLATWGPGFYDARVNLDGRTDGPVVIPPAYGLHDVALETYTGEGPVSYWNAYVAVTQMHGQGAFSDPRIGVNVHPDGPDLVQPKLTALREYQLSLAAPQPEPGDIDAAAAARGRTLFVGAAGCAGCHIPPTYTDAPRLHAPSEVPVEPTWAERSSTRMYRTTPLRGLTRHAPYFHDGSAATLGDVVERYDAFLHLGLTTQQKADLVAFLETL